MISTNDLTSQVITDSQQWLERAVIGLNLCPCLLYTSDAADERSSVDLGGSRIIKKKKYATMEGRQIINLSKQTL